MRNLGQLIRLGIWTVKPSSVPEFIDAWQAGVDWIARNLPDDGEAILLQDSDNPTTFISFASSANPAKAQEVMSQTGFQELWARVQTLCENVQPHRTQVVAYSGRKRDS